MDHHRGIRRHRANLGRADGKSRQPSRGFGRERVLRPILTDGFRFNAKWIFTNCVVGENAVVFGTR